jgi:hypothetical protein
MPHGPSFDSPDAAGQAFSFDPPKKQFSGRIRVENKALKTHRVVLVGVVDRAQCNLQTLERIHARRIFNIHLARSSASYTLRILLDDLGVFGQQRFLHNLKMRLLNKEGAK